MLLLLVTCLTAGTSSAVPAFPAQPPPPVRAGCEYSYPPYCIVTPNGQADGFSVELMRAALWAVGREVTFKTSSWAELKRDLAEKRLQALPLVGRSPEREALFEFTFPYLTMHGTIMVREGDTSIHGPSDLKGRRVAVMQGDNAEEYLRRADLGATIIPLPSCDTGLLAVSKGTFDAMVIQKLVAMQLLQTSGITNLTAVGPQLFKQSFCFATSKGDRDLLSALNEGLSIVMADGTYRQLYAKWFSAIEATGRSRSRIIIGGDKDYPPYEFLDSNGQPAGFNVDLTRAIAQQMGLSVEFRLDTWKNTRQGLETGEIDAIQGMFYSTERDRSFGFAPPHAIIQHTIVARAGSPLPVDLRNLAGKRILVMSGDILEDLAIKQGYGPLLIAVATQEEALRQLARGTGDCALVATVPALYWIRQNGWRNLRISSQPILSAEYCYAVPHGQESLLATFSEGLAALKATGDYRKIQSRWLSPYETSTVSLGKVVRIVLIAVLPLLLLLGGAFLWSRALQRQVARRTREISYSNALLEAQAEATIEGILVVDADNRILSYNRRFIEMWTLPPALVAQGDDVPVLRFVADQVSDTRIFMDRVQHLYAHPHETSRDELLLKDGRTYDRYTAPVFDTTGQYHGRVWHFRDITEHRRAEQALRRSVEEYRHIFENSVMGISEASPAGGLLRANLAYAKMFGFENPEQMLAVPDVLKHRYANLEDRTRVLQTLAAKGVLDPTEVEVVRRDGSHFFVMVSVREVRDDAGRLICYQAAHVDITERKQAEAALRDNEEKYRILVEKAREAVYVVRQGRIMFANAAFAAMAGLQKTAIEGLSIDAFLLPADRARIQEHHRRLLMGEADSGPIEIETQISNGVRRWVSISAALITWQGFPATLNIAVDITERKQAEAEHERLMAAIEQSGEVIVITSLDGTIQFVNPAFERITGYTRAEAIGQNPRILKSGSHDVAFYLDLWKTLKSGRTWKGRFINRRKDGTFYTEEATISPVLDAAGQTVNYVAVKRDITEHLQLAAQLLQSQKMESVGRLASGVAHDFNNLLMGIMGHAEMCRDRLDAGHPIRALLDEITQAAQRSAAITRQLLAFARKQPIAPIVLDLNAAVSDMLSLLRQMIGEDIDLDWQPGTESMRIRMDPAQIDQILANLMVNARDAIGGVGKITIRTEIAASSDGLAKERDSNLPAGYVVLSVIDTGCGMDAATIEHIFEPFFTTKEVGQGTGLGLATVYGIVRQNNGFVNVTSAPGSGTTFRISLPRHVAPALRAVGNRQQAGAPGGHETILVVEDEKSVRNAVLAFLRSFGYTAMVAASPAEALSVTAAHTGRIDLLITDVVMPGMSGRDLAQKLQEQQPNLKCLFMSGYTFETMADRGLLETNADFLLKPFSRDQLAHKVREVLDRT